MRGSSAPRVPRRHWHGGGSSTSPSGTRLLAAGGALALAAHPADDYVQSHIVGNTTADRFFSVGKVLGSGGFQVGWTVVGLHGKPKIVLQPVPVPSGMMIAFVRAAD